MAQPGILAPVPAHGRYLEFDLQGDADPAPVLQALAARPVDESLVWGIGPGLAAKLDKDIPTLHVFPAISGPGCAVPSTQADLWCWLRGDDRGVLALAARSIVNALAPAFDCIRVIDGFKYDRGLDLSGYEDGTENPTGDDAVDAAIWEDGSSIVAVQQWVHDLDHFESLEQADRDNIIGRRQSDNVEFEGSPPSAHTKRTAQESFTPEAFLLRRSMPWADNNGEGLVFVAFGKDALAFEAQLHRMTGGEDGVIDGLFRFTRPVTGGYYWCPPVKEGRVDLSQLGL